MAIVVWIILAVIVIGVVAWVSLSRRKPVSGIVRIEVEPPPGPQVQVRSLQGAARERYVSAWQAMQSGLDEEPEATIRQGDRLLQAVMRDCGYPTGDFSRVSGEVSPDEQSVLDNYLVAHRVSIKAETSSISDEEVQRAMAALNAALGSLLAI
ncbi:MAG: hypothetical protein ACREJX_14710 [Polyangiaceae bacterium]